MLHNHVLRAELRKDLAIEMPACVFILVRAGRIVRIDDYLDTAQVSALGSVLRNEGG